MVFPDNSVQWAPFPAVSTQVRTTYPGGDLLIRAFGRFEEDLNVDFDQENRPELVTRILGGCTRNRSGEKPDPAFFRDLTIGDRIACLINIAVLDCPSGLSVTLRCTGEDCRRPMEVDFSREEIAGWSRLADDADLQVVQLAGKELHLRKPTGRDQLEWRKHAFPDEPAAIRFMIRSLIVGEDGRAPENDFAMTDEEIRLINEAMEAFDPMVSFRLFINCPHCGRADGYELNWEEIALSELRRAQRRLLQTLHRLGAYYHWSEPQILAIPPRRREYYLAQIEKEEM